MLVSGWTLGQSNLRCQWISTDSIQLDTLPIDPASLSIEPYIEYSFDRTKNTLRFMESLIDSVEVCYLVASDRLYQPFFNRDIREYEYYANPTVDIGYAAPIRREEVFSSEDLYKSGSITRGVTVGNRQNLFVNSTLDLQMQGKLSDSLFISAVITDQNIPYQPEGNTQQLRDFDNVYVNIYNDKMSLTVGDVVSRNPADRYFLRYYKNVQGINLKLNQLLGKWQSQTEITASLAKGKFASTRVAPIEGGQGPYRLRGAQGESFIIVLANSEKVFIDGVLMKRGFDQDYVIDYNLGEIVFNNHIVITRFTRIRVDFEYAEQNYQRSNLSLNQSFRKGGTETYFSIYREKDNPDRTLGFTLEQGDTDLLQTIGDQANQALVAGVDTSQFSENRPNYSRRDTLIDGMLYSIYVYETDQDTEVFNVSFTEVPQGQGDYQLLSSTVNGRIFEWIAPVDGISQGNYSPGQLLELPNQRMLSVVGVKQQIGDKASFFGEMAISDQDRNLYSARNDGDNTGYAWKTGLSLRDHSLEWLNYRLSSTATFEYNDKNFRPIDRFRSIDFDRDWSYFAPYDSASHSEVILTGTFGLSNSSTRYSNYWLTYRKRGDVLEGMQHQAQVRERMGPVNFSGDVFYMTNDQVTTSSDWLRLYSEVTYVGGVLVPGYRFELDENEIEDANGDIITTAMHYQSHRGFLRLGDSMQSNLELYYLSRTDQLPIDGRMQNYTETRQSGLSYESDREKKNVIRGDINYLNINNSLDTTNNTEDHVQGVFSMSNRLFGDHVKSEMSYATGNSRELRREFIYLQVGAGEGTHTWRDENGDGIQDINEFYEAINFDEKNYIKLFVPTDEYVEAFNTQYTQTINARMPSSWSSEVGPKKFFSKFSTLINFNTSKKVTSSGFDERLNPFRTLLKSEELIQTRYQSRYTVFYNRTGQGIAMDFTWSDNASKQLLTNGFEARNQEEYLANARYSPSRFYQVNVGAGRGRQVNRSDFLVTRNFMLQENSANSSITFLPSQELRIIMGYRLNNQRDLDGEERSFANTDNFNLGMNWSRAGKGNLRVQTEWVKIDFKGEENSYLGYLLLDGLRPGNNLRITGNWQQTLINGIQLSVNYFGRKSEGSGFIHSGNVLVTAFF